MTEDEAKETEYLWKVMELGFSLDDHLGDYTEMKAGLSKKFGREAHVNDVILGLYNNLILQTKDPSELGGIYYTMVLFLDNESKNPYSMLQQVRKMKLMDYKIMGWIKLKLLGWGAPVPLVSNSTAKFIPSTML